jgi:membrane-bound inhibitor of C-type lysozyme
MALAKGCLAAVLFLSACKVKNTVPGLVEYKCKGDKTFWVDYGKTYSPEKPLPPQAVIHFGERALKLPQAPMGDGFRYADDFTSFVERAGVAQLTTREGLYEFCQAVK